MGMGFSIDTIFSETEKGNIPAFLLASWSDVTGGWPLSEAAEIKKYRLSFFSMFWLALLLFPGGIAGFYVLDLVDNSVLIPGEGKHFLLFSALLSCTLVGLVCLIVGAIVWMASASEESEYSKSGFGGDLRALIDLFCEGGTISEALAHTKDRLQEDVDQELHKKATRLREAEEDFSDGDNEEDIERARDEFRKAFDLACRFGFADPSVGWKPYFQG